MQGNYKTLMSYHNELNQYKRNSVLYGMLQSKIQEFYKLNGIRIQSILDKANELNKKYFTFENGQPVMDGEKQKLNEGLTHEQFEIEWTELMKTECEIHFQVKSSIIGNNGKMMTLVK